METDLNEPEEILSQLEQTFSNNDLAELSQLLRQLSLMPLLEILPHVKSIPLQIIILGQVERNIKQPLGTADRAQVLQWLVQQAEQLPSVQDDVVKECFRHMLATGVAYLCLKEEEFSKFMGDVANNMSSSQMRIVEALEIFNAMVLAASEYPDAKFVHTLEVTFLNSFVFVAFRQLNECISKTVYENQEDPSWHWNGDIRMTTSSLRLLLSCVNYDFFGVKRNATSEFLLDRSPILIPCRPSKYEIYKCFDSLRELCLLEMLDYLHETASAVKIRCLCVELLCDLSRLQMRLFKSQQSYVEYFNELIIVLNEVAKYLRLDSSDDYQHVLCYFTNIHKCLTMLSINKINHEVLGEWLLNILDFSRSQLLSKSLLPPTLIKPLFSFLVAIDKMVALSKYTGEIVKKPLGEFMLEYTAALLRMSDGRAGKRVPNTQILPILLALQPDPLEHPYLMEDYLFPYRTHEIHVLMDPMNYEELLWKLYMRCNLFVSVVQYLNCKMGELIARKDEQRLFKLQRVMIEVSDCLSKVAMLEQFSDVPRYNRLHIRHLYAYMLHHLQHCPQVIELIRAYGLPLLQAVSEVLELGGDWQHLLENSMYLAYISSIERTSLYEILVNKVKSLKLISASQKELSALYRYCFVLSADDVVGDVLSFIGKDFQLETATSLLSLTRRYAMHSKYRPLLEFVVQGSYLYVASSQLRDETNAAPERQSETAYKVTMAIYSILKIDGVVRCDRTNKAQLCLLLIPMTCVLVKFFSQLLCEDRQHATAKFFLKLVYVEKRLLEMSYLQLNQESFEPEMEQVRASVCQILYISTEVQLHSWPIELLQLCELFYRHEKSLFRDDVLKKYYLLLLNYLPRTQPQIVEIIACHEHPLDLLELLLQSINRNPATINANAKFIEEYFLHSNFDIPHLLQCDTFHPALSEVLQHVSDRKALQQEYSNIKVVEYSTVDRQEQSKQPQQLPCIHVLSLEEEDHDGKRGSSCHKLSINQCSARVSEESKDVMPDLYSTDD